MVLWVGSPRRLPPLGSAGSLWNGVCKKACSMWTHTCHVEGEARGTTTTWASGMNKTSLSPLWRDGKRWRRLCTDTFAGADHRGKWVSFLPLGRNKHLKYSCRVNEKSSHPLRCDRTRGRGDEAQRLIHSWHDSLVTQMETGELTREATWEKFRSDAWRENQRRMICHVCVRAARKSC